MVGNYKRYIAIILQDSTSDPNVTVLVNTLGVDLTWTRESQGVYIGTAVSGEPFVDPTPGVNGYIKPLAHTGIFVGEKRSTSIYEIRTLDNVAGTLTDGLLTAEPYMPIEIRVYIP